MNGFELRSPTLHLIMGNPKSGKSSEGIRIAQTYSRYVPVIYVNPKMDIRVSNGTIESRTGQKWSCISVANLAELEAMPDFHAAKLIVIDESQFIPDLYDHVAKWCDEKSYLVIGLDADSDQKKFGQIWDLIPLANKVEKLFALCEVCKDGTPSACTIATIEKTSQILLESKDGSTYLSVCRKHRHYKP